MIPLKDRRVVLIGGAGFIGHNLALELRQRGADVTVVDGLSVNNLLHFTKTYEVIQNRDLYARVINERLRLLQEADVPLYVQDARDYHAICKILDKIDPQVIVHLAAVAHAGKSNKDPYSTFDHSLRTLENALDFARSSNVEQFVYFSSSMVYGHFPAGMVTEETPCNPLGIYGALKFAGEKIVIAYNQVFDLPYTILRPSALYGERCVSRRVGQIFIENALQGKSLTIAGSGEERLDFTYIGDLTDGIAKVIESENARNDVFNLTYGESRSINDLVDVVLERFPGLEVTHEAKDALMPDRGTLSVEKARKAFGYAPQYALEKGFPRYIEWYRSFWRPEADARAPARTD